MLHRPCLLLVLFSFFSTFVTADQDVERQIVQHLDARLDESTVLLKQLVNINSGTMNFTGVKQVGKLLQQQ